MSLHTPRHFSLPLLLGIALTLILRGYQFGGGNHSVYLVAPLRQLDPSLLSNDWWTTKTLQYHLAYTHMTALFMRLGIEKPAFLALYLALVVLLHLAWLRITLDLGLDWRAYLLSVLLYYLSAGGTGLGSYMFLQDSSFLPGNVANVAMLWGLRCWIAGRTWPAAICFAIAGLFHLNHALVAIGLWTFAIALRSVPIGGGVAALTLIISLSLPNILPAAHLVLTARAKLPLDQFVDLYVKLRHPHHYNPLSWPIALWLSFLWPIPLAIVACLRTKTGTHLVSVNLKADADTKTGTHLVSVDASADAKMGYDPISLTRAAFATLFFLALLAIAFFFAGVIFIAEPIVQMSLFRFSIYPKLLTCIGAAAFLLDPALLARRSVRITFFALPIVALLAVVAIKLSRSNNPAALFVTANLIPLTLFLLVTLASIILISRNHSSIFHPLFSIFLLLALLAAVYANWLGLSINLHDRADADYRALCRFARDNTSKDAVFLVPPDEQLFRFHAQRAIVVNFKGVPQLSSEMSEWRARLRDVLDIDPTQLPKRFDLTHQAISDRYNNLPTDHLLRVAHKYNARYLVTAKPLPGRNPVFESPTARLYDLNAPASSR